MNVTTARFRRSLAAPLLALATVACSDGDSTTETETLTPPEKLHSGDGASSGIAPPHQALVLTTAEDYADALALRSGDAPADVDFETTVVVLVDMGEQTSGGYSLDLGESFITDDSYTLGILHTVPGDSCGVTTVITHPYLFVSVTTDKPLLIDESIAVHNC